jgi:uncharacterized membrane protein
MIMRILITLALVAAGTVRIAGGDPAEGVGFIAASLIMFALLSRRTLRRRQRETRGEVLQDERDLFVAGRAAIFTVRFVLAVLTAALLASLFAGGARIGPLQGILGLAAALVSGSYFFSYLLIRRRS